VAEGGGERTANLLGALALSLSDRTVDAITAAGGRSGAGAAALSALHHFLDTPSIDRLRQVLGLTSSGTVRLVDRLVEDGYVRREAGVDGRTTLVRLTPAGEQAARAVTQARARVLADALAVLSPEDRDRLADLISPVLAGLVRGPGATRWLCRLCDLGACGRSEGRCPVANEAAARYGATANPERPR
jgi:DNA-binding MarR family transcriptional regulator